MRITIGQVCVYTHSIQGKVFYVGKGISSRPFETSRRGERWHNIVSEAGHFDVEVIAWFDSDQDARLQEAQDIAKYKPEANLMGNGWRRSEEFKAAMSKCHKGKAVSPETRERIGLSRQGLEPWNKGAKTTDEQKRKLSLAQRGRNAVIETGSGTEYPSVREACRVLRIPKTTLIQHLNGKLKHAGGYVFRYVNILAAGQAVTARGGSVRPRSGPKQARRGGSVETRTSGVV